MIDNHIAQQGMRWIYQRLPIPIQAKLRRLKSSLGLTRRIERLFLGQAVFFVQIGSNDGLHGDPLRELILNNEDWRGVLVEPVPYIFERLKKNYAAQAGRLIFENAAIGSRNELTDFFYVAERATQNISALPEWFDQIGSFNRSHIVKHLGGMLDPFVLSEKIRVKTLKELCDDHNITAIDLFHIDAEGSDYEILGQLDFRRFFPKVIIFEHRHLNVKEGCLAEELLLTSGYQLIKYGGDTMAIRNA